MTLTLFMATLSSARDHLSQPRRLSFGCDVKLEGLELYAPRGARTPSAPGSQASPSQTPPHVPECDQLRADEGEQPSAAAAESLSAADTPIDDAIGTTPSQPDREPSISGASLPPAPKLRLERDPVSGPPSAFKPLRLNHHLAEPAPYANH
jgi:hypothetical protein